MTADPPTDDPTQEPDGPPVEARRILVPAVRITASPMCCVWCGGPLPMDGALLCAECRKPQVGL